VPSFALLLITLAVLVVSGTLVAALLAIRRAALRAEAVLSLLEREIQPTAAELRILTAEFRALARQATAELDRIGAVAVRVEALATGIGRVVGIVGGMTRVGQLVGTAAGVKKGLDVFLAKLRSKNRGASREG
jgi:uncharacterized protein YoxC